MATIILLSSFLILTILKKMKLSISYDKIGRVSMSIMLIFFGFSHFFIPESLIEMIPPVFPFKLFIVYSTGIIEIVLAILLLFDQTYKVTGRLLICYYIAIWPANIYHAMNLGDIPGGVEQYVPHYHWLRAILIQPLFILWAWLSTKGQDN